MPTSPLDRDPDRSFRSTLSLFCASWFHCFPPMRSRHVNINGRVGLTSSFCDVLLKTSGFDIDVCSMPCRFILSALIHVIMAIFSRPRVWDLSMTQTRRYRLRYAAQRLHEKIYRADLGSSSSLWGMCCIACLHFSDRCISRVNTLVVHWSFPTMIHIQGSVGTKWSCVSSHVLADCLNENVLVPLCRIWWHQHTNEYCVHCWIMNGVLANLLCLFLRISTTSRFFGFVFISWSVHVLWPSDTVMFSASVIWLCHCYFTAVVDFFRISATHWDRYSHALVNDSHVDSTYNRHHRWSCRLITSEKFHYENDTSISNTRDRLSWFFMCSAT